jgi:hypothetical protein
VNLCIAVGALLCILLSSCVNQPGPTAQPTNFFAVGWSFDGSNVFYLQDSDYDVILGRTDRAAHLLSSVNIGQIGLGGMLCPTNNDSTLLIAGSGIICILLTQGSQKMLSSEGRLVQTRDRSEFLMLPPDEGQSQITNQLEIARFQSLGFINQSQWLDKIPITTNGTWVTNSTFAVFQFDEARNLVDLVLYDTSLTPRDTFLITNFLDLNYGSVFYGAHTFFFAGATGVIKMDSATRQAVQMTTDPVQVADCAPDGSFIVYTTSSYEMYVLNCNTGAKKLLASHTYGSSNLSPTPPGSFKISPGSDMLAYFDGASLSESHLKIIPISAP